MDEQKKQRGAFTEECRREAAKLVIDTGRSVATVVREINVGEQSRPDRWEKTSGRS